MFTAPILLSAVLAGQPAAPPKPMWRPTRFVRTLAHLVLDPYADLEFTKMFFAILDGSQMGPGEGWFKPSQTRYDWAWLAARCGVPKSGRITPKQFDGPPELFRRLDRDRDGTISASDLDWADSAPYWRQMSAVGPLFRTPEGARAGMLSKAEWDALFAKLSEGKGYVTPDDMRAALFPPPPPTPPRTGPPTGMPTPEILLKGLFAGEIGSAAEGPRIGQLAPDFRLATPNGKTFVRLSDYKNNKPVVLIFGSFT